MLNLEDIATVNQGIDIIENIYVKPVLNYLRDKQIGHGYNNKQYTTSYS